MAIASAAGDGELQAVVYPGSRPLVELRFDYWAAHPVTGAPLRTWVRKLPEAEWDRARKCWVLPLDDLPRGVLGAAGFCVTMPDGSQAMRSLLHPEPPEALGEIPAWFGLDLAPYQVEGALAVAGGRRLLADVPGVGKTRQALAAAALLRSARTLVLCPPVVLTHWEREVVASGIACHCGGTTPGPGGTPEGAMPPDPVPEPPPGNCVTGPGTPILHVAPPDRRSRAARGEVVAIRSGRKEPPLPSSGVVIVADTLVAARPALCERLRSWQPEVLIHDEAHRAKTWLSSRSGAARKLAAASGVTVVTTGTPMFASPDELAPLLAETGYLGPVFGGREAFMTRYLRRNRFRGWDPRTNRLPELRSKLDSEIWVRRTKAQVLPDLPPKSRRALTVDIDDSGFRAAHGEVMAVIDSWLDEMEGAGTPPGALSEDDIRAWCSGQVGLVTSLRRAAGLAKVAPATEIVAEWVRGNTEMDMGSGTRRYLAPLVVWTHHRAVSEAMAAAVPEAVGGAAVIMGGTPTDERARIVDRFQAGKIPVLVCSISAAGVGITLTASADVIFVETDWTPALVSQAEDRCARLGQANHVTVTTLVAPGTLDEHIQAVLARKAVVLDKVMAGGDNHVEVLESPRADAGRILAEMVAERIEARGRRRPARARRAG